MNYTIIQTEKGNIAKLELDKDEKIDSTQDFFDAMMSAPSKTMMIEREDIPDKFFDLKTKYAGEILQKVSNYRRRLIILGDFSLEKSKSLKDFVYESNQTGQVVFAGDIETAVKYLK